MIIDKVVRYWTPEDNAQLAEIRKKQGDIMTRLALESVDPQKKRTPNYPLLQEWNKLEEQAKAKIKEVESRYLKEHGKKELLDDVREIVGAIEQKDFLERIEEQLRHIATLEALKVEETGHSLEDLRKYAVESYENCFVYILHFLRVQLNAFKDDEDGTAQVYAIVEAKVTLWYVKPQKSFVAVPHGLALDALAQMSSRGATPDKITGDLTLTAMGVQAVFEEFQKAQAALGITTHKLLMAGVLGFIQDNSKENLKAGRISHKVTIPLLEYAARCGQDIQAHTEQCTTEEEKRKEIRRAENARKDFQKTIRKDLDLLSAAALTFEETSGAQKGNYAKLKYIGTHGIYGGQIMMVIDPVFAEYLLLCPLTQWASALWLVDPRDKTSYALGKKMTEHYNLYNNIVQGTADRLKVKTLLSWTSLPEIEKIRDKKHSWIDRIKEPFENALEKLTHTYGLLASWEYTHAKGVPLTDEEAEELLESYEVWEETLVHFTLKDAPDHTARIAEIQEERKAHNERVKQQAAKKKAASKGNGKANK